MNCCISQRKSCLLTGVHVQVEGIILYIYYITLHEANGRKAKAWQIWGRRDHVEWHMDISLLQRAGLNPP